MRGPVLHVAGSDTVPLVGAWVVLHEVTAEGDGAPVDSQRTDGAGRYLIGWPERDSTAAYIVSVRYHGIAYFGETVGPPAPDEHEVAPVAVYDTSSAGPPVALAGRLMAVQRPEVDGSRRVVEFVRLENRGDRTRVSPRDGVPTWRGALPAEARDFEIGPGEVAPEAVAHEGDAVAVYAPMPPGEREFLLSYVVPAGTERLAIPIDQPTDRLDLLLQEDEAAVEVGSVTPAGVEELQGTFFRVFRADSLPAGAPLVLRLPATERGGNARWVAWVFVPLLVGAMAVTLARWSRRSGDAVPPRSAETPEALATRIAALDAEYAGREDDAYRARRAELKTRLTEALARRSTAR